MPGRSDWLFDGATAAEVYERYIVPPIFGPWAADLVEAGCPRPGERVLDLACGTGAVARRAAERVGVSTSVVAVDVNPRMLDVARSLSVPTGVSIEWREGSASVLPFTTASFDLVLCQQALQFFADRPLALRESHRVLVDGGRIAFAVWSDIGKSPGFAVLADALACHVAPDAGKWVHGPFSLHDAGTLSGLIADAGFEDVKIRTVTRPVEFPSCEEFVRRYVAATPLADHVRPASVDARRALVADVARGLGSFAKAGGLVFPMEAHVATARK